MGPIRAAALAVQFGFVVGGMVASGVLLGRYLDDAFGTNPLMLLVGLLLGLGLSFYVMYLIYQWQKEK